VAWQAMVRELAPQDRTGSYVRQSYTFKINPSDIKVETITILPMIGSWILYDRYISHVP
jgi:hypothetical protein